MSSIVLLKNVEVFGHEVQYKNMVTQAFPNHPQAAKLLDHEVLTEGVLSGFQDSSLTPHDLVNAHIKPSLMDYGSSRTPV